MAPADTRSKEYVKFLEENFKERKMSSYEKLCNFSEKLIPIDPWKELDGMYKDAIKFSHMNITSRGAFALSILSTILAFLLVLIPSYILGILSFGMFIGAIIFATVVFYYAYDYPLHYSTVFRIKASEEMVLSIVYMTIALRVTPNLENAVKFAADNMSGPLATDLRQLQWDVYTRKYDSMFVALDSFMDKWKMENREYAEAVYLIRNSISESTNRREATLGEAVNVVLNGSKERMKHYSQELNTPVTVINAMGITLPIIGLVFFPILGIFLQEMVQPIFIAVGYNIVLPITVYWMMRSVLEKRPYSFHQPDMSMHPDFQKKSIINRPLLYSFLILAPLIIIGSYGIYTNLTISTDCVKDCFKTQQTNLLLSSIVVFIGMACSYSFYNIYSTYYKLKARREIVDIESEFKEALFQLGKQLQRGIPIEKALEKMTDNIKDMTISKMFKVILNNIKVFGMTMDQAVFDKKYGAISYYPSRTILAIMKAVVEISKRGMGVMSRALLSISQYLKGVHTVEEELRDMMNEVTSSMRIQALILAPLTSGVVIALSASIMVMLLGFGEILEKMQTGMGSGPGGALGGGILGSIISLDEMIPIWIFQLVVGIYLIEVVSMLASFLSKIEYGEEKLMRGYTIGKMVIIASAIYVIVSLTVYSMIITFVAIQVG